jgi:hypothetical protein
MRDTEVQIGNYGLVTRVRLVLPRLESSCSSTASAGRPVVLMYTVGEFRSVSFNAPVGSH